MRLSATYLCFLLVSIALLFTGSASGQSDKIQRNEIVSLSNDKGHYHVFIPRAEPKRILVIAHGTPGKGETAIGLAEKFIKRWTDFAKKKKLLLISVAFDRRNFGSEGKHGYGGYRGLFGREIGADEYVIQLVEEFKNYCSVRDGRFLLYGHSAGGQFLNRFCVAHPERIAGAVASAPGRFAFPTDSARWPYGAGRFEREISWSETEKPKVIVEPNIEKFKLAATLPIAIMYGENDLDKQPKRDAHPGTTRIDYGRGWVDAMNELGGLQNHSIKLKLEPDVGHSSSRLTVPCQKELLKLDWVKPAKTKIMRLWRSKNRKFKVKAMLVESFDETVTLITDSDKTISVALKKLCDADREFLK